MPDTKHEAAISVLAELYKDYRYNGKIWAKQIVRDAQSEPLVLLVPRKGGSLTREYYPDLYVVGGPARLVDIYEVWHSETEDAAISDVLQSFLLPNASFLGVICTGYNLSKEEAQGICDFFFRELLRLIPEEKQNNILKEAHYLVCQPDEKTLKDRDALKSYLARVFKLAEEPSRAQAAAATGVNYWLTPVSGENHASGSPDAVVKELVVNQRRYAFDDKTPNKTKLNVDDWICFYASGKGIVAHAKVVTRPERKPELLPKYPWMFKLGEVEFYPDSPVIIDEELRSSLDAFSQRKPKAAWGWFVVATRKISEHDFGILTKCKISNVTSSS